MYTKSMKSGFRRGYKSLLMIWVVSIVVGTLSNCCRSQCISEIDYLKGYYLENKAIIFGIHSLLSDIGKGDFSVQLRKKALSDLYVLSYSPSYISDSKTVETIDNLSAANYQSKLANYNTFDSKKVGEILVLMDKLRVESVWREFKLQNTGFFYGYDDPFNTTAVEFYIFDDRVDLTQLSISEDDDIVLELDSAAILRLRYI